MAEIEKFDSFFYPTGDLKVTGITYVACSMCAASVCAACVQRLHCALDWKCKDCGIWCGSSIFLRFLAMGPGLDRSGTRSECENALTHRNEFLLLLLAVKEFWFWESYLSGFAAANFFESPQKSGIEDLLDAWILHCSAVLEPSEIVGYVDSLRFLDLLDLVTGGSAGPAIGSLHSVQHVCSQCVCSLCAAFALCFGLEM